MDTAKEKCYLPDLNIKFLIGKTLKKQRKDEMNILFRVFGLS